MESYLTIFGESVGEYEEKRSRFIARMANIETEEDAFAFIEKVRAENREARHNVHAFVLNNSSFSRFSDDGEPHGTAGKPVLDVINGARLKNVCVVVTRYFGGILLGTGGLCRAYSAAAKNCIENAKIVEMKPCVNLETECDYQQFNRIEPLILKNGGKIVNVNYAEKVIVNYNFETNKTEEFINNLTETFGGKLTAKKITEFFGSF